MVEKREEHPAGPIEAEHRALRSQLESLTEAAGRPGVLSALRELPKRLAEHFADEEAAGGLYADLARRSPAVGQELDALRGEHRAILEELESLSRDVQTQGGPDGMISEATAMRLARCVERLRRHEHVESKMIADVYYTDEGGHG